MKTARVILGACVFAMAASLPGFAVLQSAQSLPENAMPRYPAALVQEGVTRGRVYIAVSIDETGVVRDTLVLAHSNAKLAKVAEKALRAWRYAPARYDGEPVPVQTTIQFDFSLEGAVITSNITNLFLYDGYDNAGDHALVYRPGKVARLDRAPVRISGEAPRYATEAAAEGVSGVVQVQFFIDETGAVRLPAVMAGSNPYLMEQAVNAVRSWRFEPPTRRGSPVLVAASQEFRFGVRP